MKKWKEVRLQDLVYFQRGFDITKDKQELGDVPVISSSGVTSYHNKYMADGPGVIMGRKGSLGTIYFSKENYWPHDTTLWSKDFKGNDPKYAYYFLHTFDFKNFNVGGANPTLNRNHIHDLRIPLPPLPTQQRIAAILSAYDDLIENNRRRITLLEDSARLLYKEWFVKFKFPGHEKVKVKNGLPEGWERRKIGDIGEVTSSKRIFLSEYVEKGIPFYRSKEIIQKYKNENIDEVLYISESKFKEIKNKFGSPKAGDILVTSVGTIGYSYLVSDKDEDFYFKDGNLTWIRNIKFKEVIPYISSTFKSDTFMKFLNSVALGSSQKALTIVTLKNVEVIIPDKKILIMFNEQVTDILNQIKTLTHQTQKLREARNILLPKLMNGTIEI